MAAGVWFHVGALQSDNARLKTEVVRLQEARRQADRNTKALAEQLVATEARARETQTTKEIIYASPSGSVPADIRAALERLRDH